jgi:hypothetical protein
MEVSGWKRMRNVLIAILLLSSIAYAWNCETHTYICEQAGLGNLDCCLADSNYTPGLSEHHCANNTDDCEAREAAREYLEAGRPEIAAHLFADSMSPPHWYSFTDEDSSRCHSSVETKVGTRLQPDSTTIWPVTAIGCHTKDGRIVDLDVDMAYMIRVIGYVSNEVVPGNHTIPTPGPAVVISESSRLDMWIVFIAIIVGVIVIAFVLLRSMFSS